MVITLKNILYVVRLPVKLSSNKRAYFLYPLKLLLPLLPLPLPLYPELDSS